MPTVVSRFLVCAVLVFGLLPGARAAEMLPKRDLTVELRQVVEGREDGATHYGAGGDDANMWEAQLVQVRNGEKALLRLSDAIPMQWTQSVSTQNTLGNSNSNSNSNGNGNGNGNGNASATPASVTHALVWFDAGQSMTVLPKWPGGNKPVLLVLEVQRAAIDGHGGSELPGQSRNTVSTTVTVPLAQWQTIAATGRAAKTGVYSSEAGVQGRRLLQVRVLAP